MARLTTIPSLVLVGPTASGKTDTAHLLARRFGTGIISADAMMVYRGMNIGTAKPSSDERGDIPYLGIDIADPDHAFSVFDYLNAIEQGMTRHPKVVPWMVVGGTGLYVRSLVKGLDDDPGADSAVRQEAEVVLSANGFEALKAWCRLRQSDIDINLPPGDRQNPRRWIRAVERGVGHPRGAASLDTNVCVVGLRRDRADLENRIRQRVDVMYRQGFIDEVAMLRKTFPTFSDTAAKAIGYAEALSVLDGRCDQKTAMERTMIRTRQYAKRQMTWFRNQLPTTWIDINDTDDVASVTDRVIVCWEHHDKNL